MYWLLTWISISRMRMYHEWIIIQRYTSSSINTSKYSAAFTCKTLEEVHIRANSYTVWYCGVEWINPALAHHAHAASGVDQPAVWGVHQILTQQHLLLLLFPTVWLTGMDKTRMLKDGSKHNKENSNSDLKDSRDHLAMFVSFCISLLLWKPVVGVK